MDILFLKSIKQTKNLSLKVSETMKSIKKKKKKKRRRRRRRLLLTSSVQFSSVAQSCPTLCDPMNCSTPGFPVHHQLPEFTQILVHRVGDAIQPISSSVVLFSSCPNPSQHQSLFQGVNSSHEVAKVLEF